MTTIFIPTTPPPSPRPEPPRARGYGHGAPGAVEAGHVTIRVSEILIWTNVSYARPLMQYRIPVN